MYKIDLHTHSVASYDGGLRESDYREALESGKLDYVAITDHNTIDFAAKFKAEIGDQIIVGEEIKVNEGEIIGLYLEKCIPTNLPVKEAVKLIKSQGGLVYIPHPFESVRSGIKQEILDSIANDVDIIEIHNGRAVFQDRGDTARKWSESHKIPGASSSDSHGRHGWLKTYTVVNDRPNRANLRSLLNDAKYSNRKVGVIGVAYPKINRIKKIRRR